MDEFGHGQYVVAVFQTIDLTISKKTDTSVSVLGLLF